MRTHIALYNYHYTLPNILLGSSYSEMQYTLVKLLVNETTVTKTVDNVALVTHIQCVHRTCKQTRFGQHCLTFSRTSNVSTSTNHNTSRYSER